MWKKIAIPLLLLVTILCVAVIFRPEPLIEKRNILEYIEQAEYQRNRRYIKAIKKLLFDGDQGVVTALMEKYLSTIEVRLLPDEKKGAEVPTKYRPYLKYQQPIKINKTELLKGRVVVDLPEDDINFVLGITEHELFDEVNLYEDCHNGNKVIYEIALQEFQRMRKSNVENAGRVYVLTDILNNKHKLIRTLEHRNLTCEMLYIYSFYEHWPSIRNSICHTLYGFSTGVPSLSVDKILTIVDDEGVEKAIEHVAPELLKQYEEVENLHKKANPPGTRGNDDLGNRKNVNLRGDESEVLKTLRTFIAEGGDIEHYYNNQMTALHRTAQNGHGDIVAFLLTKGANVNAKTKTKAMKDFTALHFAVFSGHIEIARTLIENGARINEKNAFLFTPLHYAVVSSANRPLPSAFVQLLIENGADLEAEGRWGRPLFVAVGSKNEEVVKLLIAAGADVNGVSAGDQTPLHRAALNGRKKMAEILIKNGARVNAKTVNGSTPLDLTRDRDNPDIQAVAELLRKHGGK